MSFPELPYDIVESILTHTASSYPSAALTLCLVSSWVRNIAIPQLFHTVVLDSYPKHRSFLANQRLAAPQPAYGTAAPALVPLGHHVRHVYVDSDGADMHAMYDQCPRLETLALPAARLIGFSTSAPKVFPRLRSLSVITTGPSRVTDALWSSPARVRPYESLTHLRFHGLPINPLPLEGMPRLTHLALPAAPDAAPEKFDALVQRCAALLMLVLVLTDDLTVDMASAFCAHDERMYPCPPSGNSAAKWRREVDGGISIWERAAQFRASLS